LNPDAQIPAGPFSAWLRDAREAMRAGTGSDVPCGDCTACCASSYFIHIKPEETDTLEAMGKDALIDAPGLSAGHKLLGHGKDGTCPKLVENRCTVYEHRPQTCRNYDCRVFAAAGIQESPDKRRINERVAQWRFEYPSEQDKQEHEAVQSAAKFITENANLFPGGRIPATPSQLAVLAMKVYPVFLQPPQSPQETARRVVEASRERTS
jgi:Fe-S-cluster containining protein